MAAVANIELAFTLPRRLRHGSALRRWRRLVARLLTRVTVAVTKRSDWVGRATHTSVAAQIVASMRAEPRSFNRLVASDQTTETLAMLMQGRLVRINRSTFELEPWLAERWDSSADGRTHTLHLRPGVVWSDGTPFTSADVLFSLRAAYEPNVKSVVAEQSDGGWRAD